MANQDSRPPADESVRLQKVLARAGYGSRRACEQFILAGRVTVDGKPVSRLGIRVDPASQLVTVDGEPIRYQPQRHFLLNKPRGYLCTNHDPQGRPRVIDLFPADGPRLFTVGRLDEHSQGLLLVTNDGELAHRLVHPRYQVPRIYRVQVAGRPTRQSLQLLRDGLHFSDGFFRVHTARRLKTKGNSTFLDLELRQGQNREIRRLLARVGHKVMQLERIAFGPLRLGRLKVGEHRPLKPFEFEAVRALLESRPASGGRQQRRKSQQRSSKLGRTGVAASRGSRRTPAGNRSRRRRRPR